MRYLSNLLLRSVFFLVVFCQVCFCQDELVSVRNAQLVVSENIELASRDGGIVAEVMVVPGAEVEKDEVLVSLDYQFNESEVAIAKSELLIAEKNRDDNTDLQFAEKSIEVSDKVLQRSSDAISLYDKVMSQTEFERLQLEREQSVLSRDQAKHAMEVNRLTAELRQAQLAMADLNLKQRKIRSPIDGMVVEVTSQPGEWVASGESIARIINLKKLRVDVIVSAKLAGKIKRGQRARFVGMLGETKVEAEAVISFVSPEIDPVNQDFTVWAEVDNSAGDLLPGIVGELKIFNGSK